MTALRRPSEEAARRTSRVADVALGWILLFLVVHVYWYAGGSFANPGTLPPMVPDSAAAWVFEVVVLSAFPIGCWVCLAVGRNWPRGRMRVVAAGVVWFGCGLLLLRGGAGGLDDLTRATGVRNGLTGMTLEQTTGTAHPSAAELWSGYAIDAYFFAGGLIFWALALRYRAQRARARSGDDQW